MYIFNICDKELKNINGIQHIHPRKQREVAKILKELGYVSIFGSSTRPDCNEKSDIDILLDIDKLNCTKREAYDKIYKVINSPFDLLWLDEINDKVDKYQRKNIVEEAVTLC